MRIKPETNNNGATVAARALLLSIALLSGAVLVAAQENQIAPQQTQTSQMGLGGDPIRQLNLTAEQAEKIRAIREQNKDERFSVNQRLRQARRAMNDAIAGDNPSEELIEQRARQLAEAQVAVTRINAITQLRIRRVLTPEQLTKLRALQQQALIRQEQGRNPGNQDQLRPRQRSQRRRDAIQRDGTFKPNQRPRVPGNFPAGQRP